MNIELEFALWLCVVALCAMPVGAFQYKRILMMCAKQRTAEKLLDGNFYYIIPESEYVEFIGLKNAHGIKGQA